MDTNPYASPQIPQQEDPNFEHRTIRGNFVVDDLTQRDAARGYQLRHVAWLGSSLIAIPVIIVCALPFLPAGNNLDFIVLAIGVLFFIGAFASIAIHVSLDWSIFWHNLRQLRSHPILGTAGPWWIQIDEAAISIATARGQQSWPIETVRRMELNQRPIVIWLERDLAIALPKHGDYVEDDYAGVRRTLRQRIMHIGGPIAGAFAPSR
ncbi:hypothetical protein [Anatilimnocola floriformis]|uniref:hypothetical protein n=1 Tax=Anatilimnocola floriformis TaxID=2948575 RepID=UPI0020C24DA8|nr:hypothetical protein [Anatilimnocola floriformis]